MPLFNDPTPKPLDTEWALLAKIAQLLQDGCAGGGGGGGVTGISINGGPILTGDVSIATGNGVQAVNGDAGPLVSLDSGEIPEGANLYYTAARFNTAFAAKTTTDLAEGANLYFTNARTLASVLTGFVAAPGVVTAADTVLSAFQKIVGNGSGTVTSVNGDAGPAVLLDSGEIPEGANLYFTVARVRATDLTGLVSALGAITAADTVLSAFGKAQGRLAALEAGTAGPFLLRAGDTGTGAFLFTPSANDVVPLTLTTTAGSLTTTNNLVVNYGAANLLTLRNDGRLVLNGRAAFTTTSSLGHGFRVSDVNTATAVIVATIGHNLSAGVGAAGIGSILDWTLDSSTTVDTRAARQVVTWTVATHATRTAAHSFLSFNAGTEGTDLVLTAGQVQSSGGTAALPAFTNRNDPDTGSYFSAANTWAVATAGVFRVEVGGSGVGVVGAFYTTDFTSALRSGSLGLELGSVATAGWSSTTAFGTIDTKLRRDAAGILALSNTTVAAQTFRIYETTDAGLTNYSRLSLQTAAGTHMIRTEAAGTGTLRTLQVGTGPAVGTNIAGVNAIFHGGQSTGTGVGGSILLQVNAIGSSGAAVNALATRVTISSTDITHATAVRLAIASGTNQRAGNATLVAGTVTVANTTVTANTIVLLTRKTSGGTIGFAITYTVSAATSFTITSDNALDTSTFSYFLIEVP